jgi:3-deoxy-manno-octulosonate cytidylyltransferase (CMP-KDO synthetase)
MNNSVVILIPARLNSSRFPRKILALIDEKPMILHVLHRAQELNLCECYVACCCESVKEIIESGGGKAVLTDPKLPSGTDRIFAAIKELPFNPEFVINLQGDIPIFDAGIIPSILNVLKNDESIDITTPAIECKTDAFNLQDPNIAKVVFNGMDKGIPGRAIYFSRSIIPFGGECFYSHVGIYAYRRRALEKFVSLGQSYLEMAERLEQLRAIQEGMNLWIVPVTGNTFSVDVVDDLKTIERYNHLS